METRKVQVSKNDYLSVCSNGDIYHNNKLLTQLKSSPDGYLCVGNHGKRYLVHRLVASAFIEPLKRGDRTRQVHHIDGNKSNNNVSNLIVLDIKDHQHLHKQIYPTTKICVICGKEYVPEKTKRKRSKTCSYECWRRSCELEAQKRKRPILQYSKDGLLIKQWDSVTDIQNELGIYASNVNKCCNGQINTYKGYVWKYSISEQERIDLSGKIKNQTSDK